MRHYKAYGPYSFFYEGLANFYSYGLKSWDLVLVLPLAKAKSWSLFQTKCSDLRLKKVFVLSLRWWSAYLNDIESVILCFIDMCVVGTSKQFYFST